MSKEYATTFNPETYSYIFKKKFDSGTTVEMEFWLTENDAEGPMYVEIGLRSFTKRKQINHGDFEFTVRGKDGLEPAVWATERLLEFPTFFFSNHSFYHKNRMVYEIFWSDARRRDVYYKWLSRHSFFFDSSSGNKCLTRIYDRF